MQIVLSGALPDPGAARELTPHLLRAAPTLARWLERGRATIEHVDPRISGCTPFEQWQMQAHGFKPQPGQNFCSGLAPLMARSNLDENTPVWLAELVHVAPSRDGAVLLPAIALDISPDDSAALYDSARTLFEGTGFGLHADDALHWRIDLPAGFSPQCASTALTSATSVNEWWPQDPAARPWRRLINEIQMLWFDHPVNTRRLQDGLPPINSLWLFGGASRQQIEKAAPLLDSDVRDVLLEPCMRQDWGLWIASLEQLETGLFKPLLAAGKTPRLVLTGRDKFVVLAPPGLSWKHWLPGSRDAWRNWWSPQY